MNRSVIFSGKLDPQLLETLESACAIEGLHCSPWNSSRVLSPNEHNSVLLVGELAIGSRYIPESLISLATREFPEALLMLFCKEPLAGKAKTIQHGRLTLVGPPPDLDSVATSLRAVLGLGRAPTTKSAGAPNTHQLRGKRWWAGTVSEPEGTSTGSKQSGIPYFEGQSEKGFGFWLPDPDESVDNTRIEINLDMLGSPTSDSRFIFKSGKTPLAALTLNVFENTWRIFKTSPHVSCWMLSQKRLPHVWQLSTKESTNSVQRLSAVGGDIVALWFDPQHIVKNLSADSAQLDSELLLAAECGGHALQEFLSVRYANSGSEFNALVAEVD